ncbi:imidazolonepropionase [Parasulfitobacter algicola]|uniref:Imidazolonepropionase n=1 Tax=Parasulfitobacter algicola TaxID=2614809 RepID=A0ABX2ITB9_9RHOB|nr:imidazolonepropionase [Sulfitobacter algicola]NSX56149.1 imidazolonepropionase [Sulfitobacter algicola]
MLLLNCAIATMMPTPAYGLIEDGCIVINGDIIQWVGPKSDLPKDISQQDAQDMQGRLITPALIDCHTHIVHGGYRATEFEMRLNGASYEQIARAGGGIISTVTDTRAATETDLLQSALTRVDALIAEGVTIIEVKSGYGLDIDTELKMLRVARSIEQHRNVRIKTSFLGAHAVPPEYASCPNDYVTQVCIPALEAAAQLGLIDAVDGFCESIAFTPDQIAQVFTRAKDLHLPVKLHAEQLSQTGGTQLAAKFGALSVDHVEYASANDAKVLSKSGTVAVLLPGAFYTLQETRKPPVYAFRKHSVPMALATDCNPGSSPLSSILLALNMGCIFFGLTPEEALAGITRHAARALGLNDCGIIDAGMRADLAIWDVSHPSELAYRIGFNPLHKRIFGGQLCH